MPTCVGEFVSGLDDQLSAAEVIIAIKSIKNNKATGYDGIPGEFLKALLKSSEAIAACTALFNCIMNNCKYPKDWVISIIHPIYKNKGSRDNPDNYRGISLLSIVSKLYCKLIYRRIEAWVEKYAKLSNLQASLRRN